MGKFDFSSKVTKKAPWVCFSNEFGVSDLSSAGGLGYLAGDWVLLAGKLGIPFVGIGLYYEYKWKQEIDKNFLQREKFFKAPEPEFYNFRKVLINLPPLISNGKKIRINIYSKRVNGNLLLMFHEPGMRALYEGHIQSEHRLYQSTVLGFIGIRALFKLGIDISILHLNESTTVFAGIAWVDILMENGLSMDKALMNVKKQTIFTNHTLSPAAEPIWTIDQMDRYVFKNVKNIKLRSWLTEIVKKEGGVIKLSKLALMIAGHSNAVSKLHAIKAKESYGLPFRSVTNAIANRWIYPELLHTYRLLGIGDPVIDLLPPDYKNKLNLLNIAHMQEVKQHAKEDLCSYLLSDRHDQYGKPVLIPEDAKIILWTRRFTSYKRPELLFSNPNRLSETLEKNNMHIILSGKAHQKDDDIKLLLQHILRVVDGNNILKKRVHFVVNYNWQLARYFGGADIILNTPIPGWEACGTSWEKAVANWTLLCSTRDGGVADVFFTDKKYKINPPFFEITGTNDERSAESLYKNIDLMAKIIDNPNQWKMAVIKQLEAFLPIISGTRMMVEYLKLRFETNL
ncbi:MAG: alpha-glucan family phosphorylase [Patescibacteria group bacterium]